MNLAVKRLQQVALGKESADWILRDVQYLDVFNGRWVRGDVAIQDGHIAALDTGLSGRKEIDGKGKWLVPGFIDAHVHVESSLLTPQSFEQTVLLKGTTSAICDPHEIANVLGISGIKYFLEAATHTKLDLWVMLSSCVPATHMETNGGGVITAQDLLSLKSHPKALGLAEVMNIPGVIYGDPAIHEKLVGFVDRPIDGHAPLLRGRELSAYACAGICSCHESSEPQEAIEKLGKGMSVWIREGSVAKDLNALAPLLKWENSTSMGFCTDDRNPLDIEHEGHIDHLIRQTIKMGIDPRIAYRAASFSVARHYGLKRAGAIAPGFKADLVLLDDAESCKIHSVFKDGIDVKALEFSKSVLSDFGKNSVRAAVPEEADLDGITGRVHVMRILQGKIITERDVMESNAVGVAKMSVLERYGHKSKPANAYVTGFGERFKGAIASSVGHDSHNLACVGSNSRDMRVAFSALIQSGGGFCVVKDSKVLAHLALPIGGLMSNAAPHEIAKDLQKLREASKQIGCDLEEPFLQLAFLCLPVIPKLKLTDKGLVDVEQFKIIDVRAS